MKLLGALLSCLLASLVSCTVYTGDIVNGIPVISSLDVNNLQQGLLHKFYLRAGAFNGGHPIYVPVWVARGNQPAAEGKTFWLSSNLHSDEQNGVAVLQRLYRNIDVNQVTGTIIAVPGMNQVGITRNLRWYYTVSSANIALTDPNRLFPGVNVTSGGSAASNYDYAIWYGLTKNGTQVDAAIDLHAPSTGSDSPLWLYADFEAPGVQRLAELCGADIVKVDPGEPGSVETTFVDYGIPAITLEIGTPLRWQGELVDRAYAAVVRNLNDWGITNLPVDELDRSLSYTGNTFFGPSSAAGGWFASAVTLLQDVQEGDYLGTLYDYFGEVIQDYSAEYAGRVWSINHIPAKEPGAGLISLIRNVTATE